jgi:predicted RNase H-like HicB family nuclease
MVLVPSLPGCVTVGTTVDEALAMAKETLTPHIGGMAGAGEDIPEDEGKPILATVGVDPGM